MEISEMEIEFTPSMFSKRFQNRDDLINHYIEFAQKGKHLEESFIKKRN